VKLPSSEANHSSPSTAEVKNMWNYKFMPPYIFIARCLIKYVDNFMNRPDSTRPPLWSSGQSSWLQIQRSRVRFTALPDFLSSGSLSLVRITEELLNEK
jgi:hypothetical protein